MKIIENLRLVLRGRRRAMQAPVVLAREPNRGTVLSAVSGDEYEHIDEYEHEDIDELAARRRFEALVTAHLPALRARAQQLCRSHCDPEDLVQDALLRACRTRRQAADPNRMRAWLLAILTNAFIDLTRKQRRRPHHVELVDDVPMPSPIEPAPWDHIGPDDMRSAIDLLPDDVRDTYRMFALEGCDYVTIAKLQQIPKATVGTRILRARKQLRALLTKEPVAESARGVVRP